MFEVKIYMYCPGSQQNKHKPSGRIHIFGESEQHDTIRTMGVDSFSKMRSVV